MKNITVSRLASNFDRVMNNLDPHETDLSFRIHVHALKAKVLAGIVGLISIYEVIHRFF